MRTAAAELRKRPSKDVADWLMARYPMDSCAWGNALILLNNVSVRKSDFKPLASNISAAHLTLQIDLTDFSRSSSD